MLPKMAEHNGINAVTSLYILQQKVPCFYHNKKYYFTKYTLSYLVVVSRKSICAEVFLFYRIPPWTTPPATAWFLYQNSTTRQATPVPPTTPALCPSLLTHLLAPPTGAPESQSLSTVSMWEFKPFSCILLLTLQPPAHQPGVWEKSLKRFLDFTVCVTAC